MKPSRRPGRRLSAFGIAAATIITATPAIALTTVFYETMGTVSSTTPINAHQNNGGFDNDQLVFTNSSLAQPADIRQTSISSGYTNAANQVASGGANIFFSMANPNPSRDIVIQSIDASQFTDLELSFGYRKEIANSFTSSDMIVMWSTNSGSSWFNIPVTLPAFDAPQGWYLIGPVSLTNLLNNQSNLWLRWVKGEGGNSGRIDDILLQGVTADPPEVIITTPPQTVPFSTSTIELTGTANTSTVGHLTWQNPLASASGSFPVATNWSESGIPLAVGTNLITVSGTNTAGFSAQDIVTILRSPEPNLPPLISITGPSITNYNVPFGTFISFNVFANQPPGDAGQETVITGFNIPASASFTGTSGPAPIITPFSWSTDAVGTFEPAFVASDTDGAITQVVSITVQPIPPAPEGTLVVYEFGFVGNFILMPTSIDTNLLPSSFLVNADRNVSIADGNPSPAIRSTGWNVTDRYWEFTLGIPEGLFVTVTNLSFHDQRDSAGPTNWTARASVDGFSADIASGTTSTNITGAPQSALLDLTQVQTSLTIRIYGENASDGGASGGWRIDNVILNGVVEFFAPPSLEGLDIQLLGGSVGIVIETQEDVTYSLEYTTDPTTDPVTWIEVDSIPGDPQFNPITLEDSGPVDAMRIYRIQAE
ncbi:MAG TPA: hypothetical protein PKE55_10935 [Kiritimatiellia bacterium]|nr:hypothetical protein [Kiritimatiellia bacterium]